MIVNKKKVRIRFAANLEMTYCKSYCPESFPKIFNAATLCYVAEWSFCVLPASVAG